MVRPVYSTGMSQHQISLLEHALREVSNIEPCGWDVIPSTAIAFVCGFGFRLASQFFGWEEWEPWEPADSLAGEKSRKEKTLAVGLKAELGASESEARTSE